MRSSPYLERGPRPATLTFDTTSLLGGAAGKGWDLLKSLRCRLFLQPKLGGVQHRIPGSRLARLVSPLPASHFNLTHGLSPVKYSVKFESMPS